MGTLELTAIVVERGEGGLLLRAARAVADAHLQLVPGGLLQIIQDVGLGQRGPVGSGPDRRPKGPVLEREGGDGAATVIPANQIEPHTRAVDAGEQLLLFGELGLCGEALGGELGCGVETSALHCVHPTLHALPLSLSLGSTWKLRPSQ